MYTNSLFAVSGALLSVVAAVPMAEQHHRHHHQQRDYVYVPHTEVVIETVAVTKTVWVEPGEYTPEVKPQGYGASSSKSSSKAAQNTPAAYTPPAYTPPAPASSSSSSTSTSVYVAPVPTTPTSTYVAPTPYVAPTTYAEPTPYVAPTTSTTAPAPAATSASSGGSGSGLSGMAAPGKTYTGDLTWYDVGLGSCGITSTSDEAVVAISHAIFDAYSNGNPNLNPICGQYVSITGKDGQKHKAKVVDRCVGCAAADLDLGQDFFNTVTDNGDGRVGGMEWCFD